MNICITYGQTIVGRRPGVGIGVGRRELMGGRTSVTLSKIKINVLKGYLQYSKKKVNITSLLPLETY